MNEAPSWSELWDDFKYFLRSLSSRIEEDIKPGPKKGTMVEGSWSELLKPGLAKAIYEAYEHEQEQRKGPPSI